MREPEMKLKKNEREFLSTIIAVAQKLLDSAIVTKKNSYGTRKRRSGADAARLRKQVRAARRQKVPVKAIADKLGVSTAYIYQIGK
jgi:hypothetical protein